VKHEEKTMLREDDNREVCLSQGVVAVEERDNEAMQELSETARDPDGAEPVVNPGWTTIKECERPEVEDGAKQNGVSLQPAPRPCFVRAITLPTIVFAQFAGTSLWFAPNAVASQIDGFGASQLSALTSLVQAGFIVGTFVLTYFNVSDRFVPELVFALMCSLGSLFNILCILNTTFATWAILRTLVGFCLAGVYPVGMKVAAKHYPDGLGARLGILVGALTLGTAFPWILRGVGSSLPFETTLLTVTLFALAGGILLPVVLVPLPEILPAVLAIMTWRSRLLEQRNGAGLKLGFAAIREICSARDFRAAAIGYFGHMWELYAWWAYVPDLVESHAEISGGAVLSQPLTTFVAIGIGAVSCTLGGIWSLYAGHGKLPGSAVVANTALLVSMLCCFLVPLYKFMDPIGFFVFLLVWGWSVIADSGQFSALLAKSAPPGLVGTALTLTVCVGFTITVVAIQILGAILATDVDPGLAFLVLAPGPVVGLAASYGRWPCHQVWCPSSSCCSSGRNDA